MMRKFIIGGVGILFMAVVCYTAIDFRSLLYRPLLNGADNKKTLILKLDKNTSAVSFVRLLESQNLIRSPRMFMLYIRFNGFSKKLKAGIYEVKSGETVLQLLQKVLNADVLILPFRIVNGATQKNIESQLVNAPYLTTEPNVWKNISAEHPSAEGLLLADTYNYDAGSSSGQLLLRANGRLKQVLDKYWTNRDANLPYKTPYELLTAASIIEKEAAKPDERRLISGVLANRLRKRMQLQMDPTVIYGLGTQFNGKLTHQDLSIDSPYNTYLHYGLPPTPIAMVGEDAIDAAAHPTVTNYLYFVANGEGGHQFSETYVQQREAITKYRHRQ